MTVVYSSAFNASSDTNLNAYGAPDWYIVRQAVAGDTKVMAATDRVEFPGIGQTDFGCGLVHSLIGSITDYECTALVRRATNRDMGMLGARCGGIASSINYMVGSDSNNDLVLYRGNGGSVVPIKTTAASIATNAEMTVTLRVTGTNPVLLAYSIDGVSDTHSDSDANRLQTGPPGIFYGRVTASVSEVWLDNFSVDNLVVTPTVSDEDENSGGWPWWVEIMRRRKKTPAQIDYERRMAAWRLRIGEEE